MYAIGLRKCLVSPCASAQKNGRDAHTIRLRFPDCATLRMSNRILIATDWNYAGSSLFDLIVPGSSNVPYELRPPEIIYRGPGAQGEPSVPITLQLPELSDPYLNAYSYIVRFLPTILAYTNVLPSMRLTRGGKIT